MENSTSQHVGGSESVSHRRSVGGSAPSSASSADDDTRQRLISAAGPVFANRGFEGATVREICKAAGVNVASIGYHFGDKLSLYMEVIRDVRKRRDCGMPAADDEHLVPATRLHHRIRGLLTRMLSDQDAASWETQLMMREMHQPTAAFEEMVQEYFRPQFDQLVDIVGQLMPNPTADHIVQRLVFSIVGQCLYYRVGRGTVRMLIPDDAREAYFDLDSLADHITAVTIAAANSDRVRAAD